MLRRRRGAALLLAAWLPGCRRAPPPPSEHALPPASASAVATPGTAEPAPSAPPPPRTLVVSAVGDCTLGGDDDGTVAHRATPFDLAFADHGGDDGWFFSGTREILAADDLTIANLEGVLTDLRAPVSEGKFHFRGRPAYARMLAAGSVEVVNLANNHSFDFGDKGYRDTLAALEAAGVGAAGNGRADRRTVRGVEIVNLGFTGGGEGVKKRMIAEIERAKTKENLVIVSFHWGSEHTHRVLPLQRDLGRAAIDAGADLVLGTHPHVIQAIEEHRGRHIVHSLGNFVFGGNVNPDDKDAIVYQETFAEQDGAMVPVASKVIPVRVSSSPDHNDFRPVPLAGEDRERVLARLRRYGEELPPLPAARPSPTLAR
jgi:poly-gamma-glutamate capsule biosynthesis protein CapA/YwtB (metallophosphatase superfamily)